jgi:hypothetical protein
MKRVLDISIAAILGGFLGSVIGPQLHHHALNADHIHANTLSVDGELGSVYISGDAGISLNREDYAQALLWFHEPGTGKPGTGGPVLWISGKEAQAFKASPAGQEMVPLNRDKKDEN